MIRIALIGDHNPEVTAHRAIPRAIELAVAKLGGAVEPVWMHTAKLDRAQLANAAAIWCVPASPYANTRAAIDAIRFAREMKKPFLGTCGGFQHALLEYAEEVWKLDHAAHAEVEPNAEDPVIAPLSCSLVEASGVVIFDQRSRLAAISGTSRATETYHCRYGLAPRFTKRLAAGTDPLHIAARDESGEVRAVELNGHPFFIATLYQPERAALADRSHPLIESFIATAIDGA